MPTALTNLVTGALRSFLAMPRAEQVFALLAGAAVTGAGVALGPMMLMAADKEPPPPPSQVVVESGIPSDPERLALIEALTRMLSTCKAIVGEHDSTTDGAPSSITLWQQDTEDAGTVNLTEVLTISHNSLLQTLTAFTAPDGPPDAPAPSWLTYADEPVAAWREIPGAIAVVIATGVTDLRVSRAPEAGGSATVRLGLTWGAGMSDAEEETVLAITLPSFQGR